MKELNQNQIITIVGGMLNTDSFAASTIDVQTGGFSIVAGAVTGVEVNRLPALAVLEY